LKVDGNTLPFQEESESDGWVIRRFSADVATEDLRWHRDGEDREIIAVESSGWSLQKDDRLPQVLHKGECHSVRKGEWHRLIKGSGELVLRIKKL
jgi:hypothetical protein